MSSSQAINNKTRTSMSTTVLAGIVLSAVTGTAAYFWGLNGRVIRLETIQENRGKQEATPAAKPEAAKPEELVSIIQEQQKAQVKESSGQQEWQCFTEDDLKRFVDNKKLDSITEQLKHTPRFLNVVLGVRLMEPGHRAELIRSADKPLRPTWSQLGRISPEGQTDSGQNAEKMIASAIVRLVKELIKLPEDKFLRLYNE